MNDDKAPGPQLDTAILDLNQAIFDCIREYEKETDITFDLPEFEQKPAVPKISVFLFDVHEDLELRHSAPRRFVRDGLKPETAITLKQRTVNVTCRYLITYWGSVGEDGESRISTTPTNQGLRTMNKVLNALLNKRRFSEDPSMTARVIPPMDLQNLGTLWQALGNRPRLCLGYDCTIPIQLREVETIWPVDPEPDVGVLPIKEAIASVAKP